ncbi:hypothetical protein BKA83DRAFT_4128620 [Pisolithus microcarpus]|nr:hypothetical protein BKA83DRAFT_4128620 [Pisolithus microcarpus]
MCAGTAQGVINVFGGKLNYIQKKLLIVDGQHEQLACTLPESMCSIGGLVLRHLVQQRGYEATSASGRCMMNRNPRDGVAGRKRNLLCDTAAECGLSMGLGPICLDELMFWMEKQSLQLITLAVQVAWTTLMEGTLDSGGLPEEPLHTVGRHLPAGVEASNMPNTTQRRSHCYSNSGNCCPGTLLRRCDLMSFVLEFAEPIVCVVDFTTSYSAEYRRISATQFFPALEKVSLCAKLCGSLREKLELNFLPWFLRTPFVKLRYLNCKRTIN